jgi:dihydroorotate dehydrogenase (NAD+) catalytic subunit
MVWDVFKAVKVPVIGMGGIMNATDAIEFLLAGSSAIQVGTVNYIDPAISIKILEGIEDYMVRHGVKSVTELIGGMKIA